MEPIIPRRILAAVDFSEASTWALRHAVMWTQRSQGHLTVLHACELVAPWPDDYLTSVDLDRMNAEIREEAERRLAATVREQVPPDLPVSHEVVVGPPAEEIERYARTTDADLVVLGTHGRRGFYRVLMGSVAERMLRTADRPTLIVRPEAAGGGEAGTPQLRHILCPVNETDVARAALEVAGAVARLFSARLTMVSVIEPGQESTVPERLQAAEERLRAWLPPSGTLECEIKPVVRRGNAAEQVIDLARETAADLLVIGGQHRFFADTTVLGVTTVRVTRHAPCPVLVVPRRAP